MRGALGSMWSDRPSAFTRFDDSTKALQGWDEQAPMAAQYFGGAGTAYAEKYGLDPKVMNEVLNESTGMSWISRISIWVKP